MLTYFPAPYPDEWWYSVLCRYHVRSGRPRSSTTCRELYGEQRRFIIHERLFPNASCYIIAQQMPPDMLDLKNILYRHTLLLYYIRFYSIQQKTKILNNLLAGNSGEVNLVRPQTLEGKQGLKFCPVCYTEDTEKFGEPYWHREHQIPLMSLCPKHGCRLHLVETDVSKLEIEFLPLSKVANAKTMTCNSDCYSWEPALTNALFSILTLPFEVGPTNGYNNLENTLKSDKFSAYLGKKNLLYEEKFYQWSVEFYGETICRQHLFQCPPSIYLSRFFKWEIHMPEKYALLCVLADLSIKDLFGPELYGLDSAKEKLIEYKNKGIVYKKYELAQLLGISEIRLDLLVARYHIEPFWYTKSARTKHLKVNVTKNEKQCIIDAIYAQHNTGQKLTNRQISKAVRQIVIRQAERTIAEYNNTDNGHM